MNEIITNSLNEKDDIEKLEKHIYEDFSFEEVDLKINELKGDKEITFKNGEKVLLKPCWNVSRAVERFCELWINKRLSNGLESSKKMRDRMGLSISLQSVATEIDQLLSMDFNANLLLVVANSSNQDKKFELNKFGEWVFDNYKDSIVLIMDLVISMLGGGSEIGKKYYLSRAWEALLVEKQKKKQETPSLKLKGS